MLVWLQHLVVKIPISLTVKRSLKAELVLLYQWEKQFFFEAKFMTNNIFMIIQGKKRFVFVYKYFHMWPFITFEYVSSRFAPSFMMDTTPVIFIFVHSVCFINL